MGGRARRNGPQKVNSCGTGILPVDKNSTPRKFLPKSYYQLPIINYQFPIPNSQCPMPNAQCPMPNAQCPIPNAQFPITNSQLPKSAACLFYTRLHAPERRINSVLFDKLFVLPRFYHYPLLHNNNAVSIADSRKTVGDRTD